jgi:putative endonuclease
MDDVLYHGRNGQPWSQAFSGKCASNAARPAQSGGLFLQSMTATWRQQQGTAGEVLAARYLEARQLVVLVKTFRCKAGEIDLICLCGDTLIIVEVRQRSSPGYGGALACVGARKQRRIMRATQYLLLCCPQWRDHRIRFDVVALHGDVPGVH